MIADVKLADFNSYIADVISGEQLACVHIKAACERHLRDLERQESSEFPYYFDEDHAQYVIDWFPKTIKHTLGRHAGLSFQLEPWQQFGIGSIYGWKRIEDGTRRFRRVFWTMGRKNGKSCLAAAMSIFGAYEDIDPETGKPEAVGQVILAAARREQADLVTFAEVDRMCSASAKLKRRTEKRRWKLHNTVTKGEIVTIGSNKPYDGLNPNVVILDELHAWREVHRPFYDTMLTGSGTRSQPLQIVTTTAGDDKSFIWLSEHKYAMGVAAGTIEDEKLFAYIFELDEGDEPLDESVWIKANPNLGVSIKPDFMKDQARIAKESVLDLNRFRRYHANVLVESSERPISIQEWDECEGELSDWATADAVGAGVDLGGRDDLASFALVARFKLSEGDEESPADYRYECRQWSYIARNGNRDLTEAPFADWVHDEQLHASSQPLERLRDSLVEQCIKWNVDSVAYDPAGGQFLAEQVEQQGILIASMGQNCRHFHEPITDMLASISQGKFTHNGDPVLRWAIGNVMVVRDRQDRWMFDKRTSREKIDPAVALVMAYRRCQASQGKSDGMYLIS